MRTVNIAKLKNELSRYLDDVRRGEEVVIRDRNVPIARIVPIMPATLDDEERALAAEGLLRPRARGLDATFWKLPAPKISARRVVRAVIANRDDDR